MSRFVTASFSSPGEWRGNEGEKERILMREMRLQKRI